MRAFLFRLDDIEAEIEEELNTIDQISGQTTNVVLQDSKDEKLEIKESKRVEKVQQQAEVKIAMALS